MEEQITKFPQQSNNLPQSSYNIDECPTFSQNDKIETETQSQIIQQIEILGAVKIKDGLFLGDEFASQDLEFVMANKITHIINCAGRQIFNQWTEVGVKYLTFYWLDDDRQLLFDDNDQVAKEIYDFIEEASQENNGVLVHSIRGQSRACCVLSIYLMMKFKWSLLKSLEFINSRRSNLEIRASFLQQLSAWERRDQNIFKYKTEGWTELQEDKPQLSNEELLLRNTFINSQMQPVNLIQQWKEDIQISIQSARCKTKIKWCDNMKEEEKHKLITNSSKDDLIYKDENNIIKIESHKKVQQSKTILKKIQLQQEKLQESNKSIKQEVKQNKNEKNEQFQIMEKTNDQNLQCKPKKNVRPVTPLIQKSQRSDLIDSPTKTNNETQKHNVVKRSNSIKKINKEKDIKDKKDKYKAKIGWTVQSPKNKCAIFPNFKDDEALTKQVNSPNKNISQSSTILKRELLEKARKALADNAKVSIGLDIKKIQETLNKISAMPPSKSLQQSRSNSIFNDQSSQQLLNQIIQNCSGKDNQINLGLNNNINNFFIQNAQLIDPQQKPFENNKIQTSIGQYHHKRANSGSLKFSQQLKKNLSQTSAFHKKNQLSDFNIHKFIVPYQAPKQFMLSQRHSEILNKKDFKQMIRQIQKQDAIPIKKKTKIASQQQLNGLIGLQIKTSPYLKPGTGQIKLANNTVELITNNNNKSERANSANRNRKLKNSTNYFLFQAKKQVQQRRSKTPMPISPKSGINNMDQFILENMKQKTDQFSTKLISNNRIQSPSILSNQSSHIKLNLKVSNINFKTSQQAFKQKEFSLPQRLVQ